MTDVSATALNRATLARQHLLERVDLDPVAAIEVVAGLQAQEAASPYVGLWTRLVAFEATQLDRALAARAVVKGGLMRSTLHVVSARDYRYFLPAVLPLLQGIRRQDRSQPPSGDELVRLAAAAAVFTAEPRTLAEVRAHLAEHGRDGRDPDELLWWLRRHAPFIHAPTEGLAWSFGRRPRIVDAATWLRDPATFATEDDGLDHLVRRYLTAFGPATAADASQWSGVPIGRLRPAIARLEASGEVERLTDDGARALVDVVDGLRPPADTPAPPRLMPMWDETLLAFADRTRIISDADRAVVIARNGDTLPTFTVDGRVAGLWWAELDARTATPRIVLEPFRPIPAAARRELEREGEALADWIAPLEPTVYARYRRTRARRPMPA